MIRKLTMAASVAAVLLTSACATSTTSATSTAPTPTPPARAHIAGPRRGHVVVVVMENHSYSDVAGHAPYLDSLARHGLSLTRMRAVTHPSEPNYLALFSGSTQGLTDDSCPHRYTAANLGGELRRAHLTFAGYSEGLPRTGSAVCTSGSYARKHAPWTNFTDLPASVNRPLTDFPADVATLPTVSFVIPNLDHDMHDGTIAQADAWLRGHLASYATWASSHDSLLAVTWDEDDGSEQNRIPTVIVGSGVAAHSSTAPATLYGVLRLIEDRYGLPRVGASRTAPPIVLR